VPCLPAGLIVSALAFGAAHLANPNASLLAAVAIAAEAGLLLGGSYILTGRIWLPAGIHTGWNLMLGGVLGARVSECRVKEASSRAFPSRDRWTW
jgi:membrane protease YdiL (CAAX protease family)